MFHSDDFLPTRPVLAAIYRRQIESLAAVLGEGALSDGESRKLRIARNFTKAVCIRMSWTGDHLVLVLKQVGPELSVAEFEESGSSVLRPQQLTNHWCELPRRPKSRVLDGEEWVFEVLAGSYQAIARRRDNMEPALSDFCDSIEQIVGVRVGPTEYC